MKLGFLTAIVPDLSLEEIVAFAAAEGFQCLEVCCWPPGKAERRYAGVTHIDVVDLDEARANAIRELLEENDLSISGRNYRFPITIVIVHCTTIRFILFAFLIDEHKIPGIFPFSAMRLFSIMGLRDIPFSEDWGGYCDLAKIFETALPAEIVV